MTDLPVAASPYRVPRSRIDDNFDRGRPLPYVQVGAAEVIEIAGDGETCTVDFGDGDDPVGGVVVLGDNLEIGDWVEVHARGDLLVTPETPDAPGTDTGGGTPTGGTLIYTLPLENAVMQSEYEDHSSPVILAGGSVSDGLDSTGAVVSSYTAGAIHEHSAIRMDVPATPGPLPTESGSWEVRLDIRSKIDTTGTGYHATLDLYSTDSFSDPDKYIPNAGIANDGVFYDTIHRLTAGVTTAWINAFQDGTAWLMAYCGPTSAVTPNQDLDWTITKATITIFESILVTVTAGTPGSFSPADKASLDVYELNINAQADPDTAWASTEYVVTLSGQQATWNGSEWVEYP